MALLETATAYLATQLTALTAVGVVYSRGATSVSINATRASTPYEASDADGVIHRTIARDYLIAATLFPFSDLPRDGDTIIDLDETYIVHSMPGSPPYRYSDPGRSILRIHTKKQ